MDRSNGRLVDDSKRYKRRGNPPAGLSYPTRVHGAVVGRLETVDLVKGSVHNSDERVKGSKRTLMVLASRPRPSFLSHKNS